MSRSVQLTTAFLTWSTLVGTNLDSRWHGPASWNSLSNVGAINDHQGEVGALAGRERAGAHHRGKDTSSQAPAATPAMPATRAIDRPTGVSFSNGTSRARSAIHSTFMMAA